MLQCYFLQPQNILLTEPFPKGTVKICDLGFACLVNTGEDIRDIIGTPDYVGKLLEVYWGNTPVTIHFWMQQFWGPSLNHDILETALLWVWYSEANIVDPNQTP